MANASFDSRKPADLADSIVAAFTRGVYDFECSSGLVELFPGVPHLSISVVVGDKVLITHENLLKPGVASVCFDRVAETVSGQALLMGDFFSARTVSSRPYSDLVRASSSERCTCLVSLPICRPAKHRRTSFGKEEASLPCSRAIARASVTTAGGATTQDDCSEYFGAYSQRREQAPMGCVTIGLRDHAYPSMTHLNSMRLLTDMLAPLLVRQSQSNLEDMAMYHSAGGRHVGGGYDTQHPCGGGGPGLDMWISAVGLDDIVDDMVDLCRCSPSAACCNCKAAA